MAALGLLVAVVGNVPTARASGGPLGIDHRLHYDNNGIWKRSHQKQLIGVVMLTAVGGALWEGNESRIGNTFWQSTDALGISLGSAFVLKRVFQRERPRETDNPNRWFQGCCQHTSFPSGEVTEMTAMITPFVLEYRHDTPWVYALEVLPLYDSIARMKTRGHWQTDVLAGWALGTTIGWYAHSRKVPITIQALPKGFAVGLKIRF